MGDCKCDRPYSTKPSLLLAACSIRSHFYPEGLQRRPAGLGGDLPVQICHELGVFVKTRPYLCTQLEWDVNNPRVMSSILPLNPCVGLAIACDCDACCIVHLADNSSGCCICCQKGFHSAVAASAAATAKRCKLTQSGINLIHDIQGSGLVMVQSKDQ